MEQTYLALRSIWLRHRASVAKFKTSPVNPSNPQKGSLGSTVDAIKGNRGTFDQAAENSAYHYLVHSFSDLIDYRERDIPPFPYEEIRGPTRVPKVRPDNFGKGKRSRRFSNKANVVGLLKYKKYLKEIQKASKAAPKKNTRGARRARALARRASKLVNKRNTPSSAIKEGEVCLPDIDHFEEGYTLVASKKPVPTQTKIFYIAGRAIKLEIGQTGVPTLYSVADAISRYNPRRLYLDQCLRRWSIEVHFDEAVRGRVILTMGKCTAVVHNNPYWELGMLKQHGVVGPAIAKFIENHHDSKGYCYLKIFRIANLMNNKSPENVRGFSRMLGPYPSTQSIINLLDDVYPGAQNFYVSYSRDGEYGHIGLDRQVLVTDLPTARWGGSPVSGTISFGLFSPVSPGSPRRLVHVGANVPKNSSGIVRKVNSQPSVSGCKKVSAKPCNNQEKVCRKSGRKEEELFWGPVKTERKNLTASEVSKVLLNTSWIGPLPMIEGVSFSPYSSKEGVVAVISNGYHLFDIRADKYYAVRALREKGYATNFLRNHLESRFRDTHGFCYMKAIKLACLYMRKEVDYIKDATSVLRAWPFMYQVRRYIKLKFGLVPPIFLSIWGNCNVHMTYAPRVKLSKFNPEIRVGGHNTTSEDDYFSSLLNKIKLRDSVEGAPLKDSVLQRAVESCYLEDFNFERKFQKGKPYAQIPYQISEHEQHKLVKAFPELRIKFINSVHSLHPLMAAVRQCYNTLFCHKFKDVPFADIGGDLRHHVLSGSHAHICNPLVDAKDAVRYVRRKSDWSKTVKDNTANIVAASNKISFCYGKAQECSFHCSNAVAVEVYDLSPGDVADIMVNRGIVRMSLTMLLPGELFDDSKGVFTVPDFGVQIMKHAHGKVVYIMPAGQSYEHDLKVLTDFVTKPYFVKGNQLFHVELVGCRFGISEYCVTRMEVYPDIDTTLTISVPRSTSGLVLLRLPEIDTITDNLNFNYCKEITVDKEFFTRAITHAINVCSVVSDKTFEYVMTWMRNNSARVVISGRIIHTNIVLPPQYIGLVGALILVIGVRYRHESGRYARRILRSVAPETLLQGVTLLVGDCHKKIIFAINEAIKKILASLFPFLDGLGNKNINDYYQELGSDYKHTVKVCIKGNKGLVESEHRLIDDLAMRCIENEILEAKYNAIEIEEVGVKAGKVCEDTISTTSDDSAVEKGVTCKDSKYKPPKISVKYAGECSQRKPKGGLNGGSKVVSESIIMTLIDKLKELGRMTLSSFKEKLLNWFHPYPKVRGYVEGVINLMMGLWNGDPDVWCTFGVNVVYNIIKSAIALLVGCSPSTVIPALIVTIFTPLTYKVDGLVATELAADIAFETCKNVVFDYPLTNHKWFNRIIKIIEATGVLKHLVRNFIASRLLQNPTSEVCLHVITDDEGLWAGKKLIENLFDYLNNKISSLLHNIVNMVVGTSSLKAKAMVTNFAGDCSNAVCGTVNKVYSWLFESRDRADGDVNMSDLDVDEDFLSALERETFYEVDLNDEAYGEKPGLKGGAFSDDVSWILLQLLRAGKKRFLKLYTSFSMALRRKLFQAFSYFQNKYSKPSKETCFRRKSTEEDDANELVELNNRLHEVLLRVAAERNKFQYLHEHLEDTHIIHSLSKNRVKEVLGDKYELFENVCILLITNRKVNHIMRVLVDEEGFSIWNDDRTLVASTHPFDHEPTGNCTIFIIERGLMGGGFVSGWCGVLLVRTIINYAVNNGVISQPLSAALRAVLSMTSNKAFLLELLTLVYYTIVRFVQSTETSGEIRMVKSTKPDVDRDRQLVRSEARAVIEHHLNSNITPIVKNTETDHEEAIALSTSDSGETGSCEIKDMSIVLEKPTATILEWPRNSVAKCISNMDLTYGPVLPEQRGLLDDYINEFLYLHRIEVYNMLTSLIKCHEMMKIENFNLAYLQSVALDPKLVIVDKRQSKVLYFDGTKPVKGINISYQFGWSIYECKLRNFDVMLKDDSVDFIITHKDLEFFYSNPILCRFGIDCDVTFTNNNFELRVIETPPGGGKTSELISLFYTLLAGGFNVRVITANKNSAEEIRVKVEALIRVSGNFGATEMVSVRKLLADWIRTVDSTIINVEECLCDVLLVDEIFLMHAGQFLLGVEINQPAIVVGFGDSKQIGYISRATNYIATRFDVKEIIRPAAVEYRSISYRCPYDVCLLLSQLYDRTVINVNTNNNKTMVVNPVSSIEDVKRSNSSKYLTFTQGEKYELKRFFDTIKLGLSEYFDVQTVHEAQGNTYSDVQLVRLKMQDDDVFSSECHAIVALSRHTDTLTYNVITSRSNDYVASLIEQSKVLYTMSNTYIDDQPLYTSHTTDPVSRPVEGRGKVGGSTWQSIIPVLDEIIPGSTVLTPGDVSEVMATSEFESCVNGIRISQTRSGGKKPLHRTKQRVRRNKKSSRSR